MQYHIKLKLMWKAFIIEKYNEFLGNDEKSSWGVRGKYYLKKKNEGW